MAGKPEFNRGLGSSSSPFKIDLNAASKDAKAKGGKGEGGSPSANQQLRAQSVGMQKQTGKGRGGRRKTG